MLVYLISLILFIGPLAKVEALVPNLCINASRKILMVLTIGPLAEVSTISHLEKRKNISRYKRKCERK
jgi:hypothetical protein